MFRSFPPLLLLVTGAISLVPARAWPQARDTTASVRTLLATEDARFAAMVRADTARLRAALADDLVYVHSNGRRETKAQYLESVGSGTLRYQEFAPRDRQVRLFGPEAAMIVGVARLRAAFGSQTADFDVRYVAVYAHEGDRWRLVAWQTTRIQ